MKTSLFSAALCDDALRVDTRLTLLCLPFVHKSVRNCSNHAIWQSDEPMETTQLFMQTPLTTT